MVPPSSHEVPRVSQYFGSCRLPSGYIFLEKGSNGAILPADTLSSYVAGRKGTLPGSVAVRGISAMLESDNTLRLYLGFKDVEPSTFTFKIDGTETVLRQRSDGMYYLALNGGVFSNRLHDPHTYSVSDGTYNYTISASVLTYARSCAIKSKEEESNLGKALYLYNQAASALFAN